MKNTIENRTEYIPRVRLTRTEKLRLLEAFEQSYHTSMAAFVREKLFEKEGNTFQKLKIDALLELAQFQTELSRVGNNINQVAKALNTYKQGEMRLTERQMMQELIPLFNQIMNRLNSICLLYTSPSPRDS